MKQSHHRIKSSILPVLLAGMLGALPEHVDSENLETILPALPHAIDLLREAGGTEAQHGKRVA